MPETKTDNIQIALVTGASGGIGKAIAIALAQTGRFVYLNFNSNRKKAKAVLEDIISKGGNGALLQFDVSCQEESEKAIKKIIMEKGKIDILVNNAGIRDDINMLLLLLLVHFLVMLLKMYFHLQH